MEMTSAQSADLHREIKAIARRVRGSLQEIETVSSFHLTIKVFGRVHDSEFKVTYQIGEYENVKGKDLYETLREYMRRHGWDERNDPPMISDLRPVDNDC